MFALNVHTNIAAKGSTKAGSAKLKTGLGHVIGYMPKRGDFDTEYDNDAELILADMEFKADDTEIERSKIVSALSRCVLFDVTRFSVSIRRSQATYLVHLQREAGSAIRT